jgi:tRNA(His) 5'-end guanylyltransferase
MHFSDKQLRGISTFEQLEMLRSKGIEWEDMPAAYKYGVLVKKERVEHVTMDSKGNPVKTTHSRLKSMPLNIDKFTLENEKLLCNKYWEM